jgi:hypothetical protein
VSAPLLSPCVSLVGIVPSRPLSLSLSLSDIPWSAGGARSQRKVCGESVALETCLSWG